MFEKSRTCLPGCAERMNAPLPVTVHVADFGRWLPYANGQRADTWEDAESSLQKEALAIALQKGGLQKQDIEMVYAGDLLGSVMYTLKMIFNLNLSPASCCTPRPGSPHSTLPPGRASGINRWEMISN